jgi:hypothetical protein
MVVARSDGRLVDLLEMTLDDTARGLGALAQLCSRRARWASLRVTTAAIEIGTRAASARVSVKRPRNFIAGPLVSW